MKMEQLTEQQTAEEIIVAATSALEAAIKVGAGLKLPQDVIFASVVQALVEASFTPIAAMGLVRLAIGRIGQRAEIPVLIHTEDERREIFRTVFGFEPNAAS